MEPVPEAFKRGEQAALLGTIPGTFCIFITEAIIDEMLSQPTEMGKKANLEPLKSMGLGIDIVTHDNSSGGAEVHRDWDDIWMGLRGEMLFILDGQLDLKTKREVGPGEDRANGIIGGRQHLLFPGHMLIIPAGTAHQNMCPNGVAKALIIKRLRSSLVDEVGGGETQGGAHTVCT